MNFIRLIPSIILIIICNTFSFAEILHNDFSNAIEGIYKKRSVETVEKFESFLEKNPSLAKTMRYGVLMTTGVKGLLTSGLPKALVALGFGEALSTASSWAGGKVEGMVAEVATSESEARRFMKALKTCAETAGVVVGVKIVTKTAKSLKASKIQSPVIKDALSERPIIKDGKVWLGDKELGEAAALNKAPYNPRKMEALLKQSGSEVTSSTLPPVNAKNVKLAGQRHPKTGIVFDQRGFPVYDDIAKVEVRITGDLGNMKSEAHMKAATRQLKSEIEAGRIDRKIFTDKQWLDIQDEVPQIAGFTWHHHQDVGRMQLIDREIHKNTGHFGGNKLWGWEKSKK